ncbi:hypothetical protein [Nannocystis punicea]|uniref:Uncharacterized protein n=1 Tax=Nannocystis punicea TaxID=2995304 RepID=A0ABY7H6Z8_9BACT|nr:hypothetical protein [Nannocystis poenicansa]WAS94862.1 hypothetical protein O0S08_01765 [Nannocystis poenicansa]
MVQIGEPVGVPGASSPPREWQGEVTEVSFNSGITAARDKAEIRAPHWRIGEDLSDPWELAEKLRLPEAPYSKKAAVYLVDGAGGAKDVEIKVRVSKCVNVSGTGKLVGSIGPIVIEGDCPLAVGEHTVKAQIKELPEAISHLRGLLQWSIEAGDLGRWALNASLVELFFILARPISPYKPGVWVEALRLVCQRGPVIGLKPDEEARVVANITRYCHADHEMEYDTEGGGSFFGVDYDGGEFVLSDYLARASSILNCYDQAGAIQALAGAVGANVKWIFLTPFGFIHPANLVGIGLCNSPFFKFYGTEKIVAADDPLRTGFGNHAFVEHGKIHDACAGPHLGTESRQQYIDASIDAAATRLRGDTPGTVADMKIFAGVTIIT